MRCQRCHHPLVELRASGPSTFTLQSCSHCDHRTWTIDGEAVSLDEVVAGVADWANAHRPLVAAETQAA
jgi:hypothetical protein